MSYRISYLMPKKRIRTFNRKKTVMSSTGSTHQKIVHSQKECETEESIVSTQKEGETKESITHTQKACEIKDDDIKKVGEDQKGKIPQQRKSSREVSEAVRCEEKMPGARRGTRSLGMGEKSDNHH